MQKITLKNNKEIIKLKNKLYYEKNKHKKEFMIKMKNRTKKSKEKNKEHIKLYGRKYNVKKRYNLEWEESNLIGLCPNHHFLIHKKGYTLKQLRREFKDGKI